MQFKCWSQHYCKHVETCSPDYCPAHVIMQVLYSQSNIPKRYQYGIKFVVDTQNDKNVFGRIKTIQDNISTWVEEGHSLVLMSPTKGNGKTSIACKLAHDYIKSVLDTTILDPAVYFINVPQFLEELRPNNTDKDKLDTVMKRVREVPLLIMDDVGAEKPSDWVRERLYSIINDRYSDMKSTIYTTNSTMQDLSINLQERIVSRMTCDEVLVLDGTSKRGRV